MPDASARDRLHIKYCRDTRCRIEGDAGEDCKNMDFLIGNAAQEAVAVDPAVQEVTKTEGRVTLSEHSDIRLVFNVTGKPDTENGNLPGGILVRPVTVVILMYFENRRWGVSLINVIGPKVHRSTGAVTKKHYEVPFTSPLEAGSPTPEWLDRIGRAWEDRMNGATP